MKIYSMGNKGWQRARRRIIIFFVVIAVIAIPLSLFIGLSASLKQGNPNQDDIWITVLSGASAVVLIAALMVFSFYRAVEQQKAIWDSIQVELGEDYIARRQIRIPEVRLKRGEIIHLEDLDGALCLRTANKYRSLSIPKTIDGYEEIKSTFLTWRIPLSSKGQQFRWLNRLSGGATLIGLGVLFFVFDPRLVLIAWIGLLALFGYFYWVLWRSEGVDPRYRRNFLFLIIWIILIGGLKFGLSMIMSNPIQK